MWRYSTHSVNTNSNKSMQVYIIFDIQCPINIHLSNTAMHIYLSNTVIFLSIGSLTRTARPLPDMVSPVLSLYLLHLSNLKINQRHHHHEIRKQEISTVSSNKLQVCCNITGVLLFRVTPSETEHQNPIQLDSFAVQITEDLFTCNETLMSASAHQE